MASGQHLNRMRVLIVDDHPMHDESIYAERVLRAGARGYITKRGGGERLLQAIREVAREIFF